MHIGELAGNATVRTRSGTNGGTTGIRIDELVRVDVTLEAQYGSIEICVRPGTSARFDAGTEYGQVRNTLETTHDPAGADENATVRARTSYGDIVIRRAEPTPLPR